MFRADLGLFLGWFRVGIDLVSGSLRMGLGLISGWFRVRVEGLLLSVLFFVFFFLVDFKGKSWQWYNVQLFVSLSRLWSGRRSRRIARARSWQSSSRRTPPRLGERSLRAPFRPKPQFRSRLERLEFLSACFSASGGRRVNFYGELEPSAQSP